MEQKMYYNLVNVRKYLRVEKETGKVRLCKGAYDDITRPW